MPKQSSNESIYWQLKEAFHYLDALLEIMPRNDSTQEHFILCAHANIEQLMSEFQLLSQADKDADKRAYAYLQKFKELKTSEQLEIIYKISDVMEGDS